MIPLNEECQVFDRTNGDETYVLSLGLATTESFRTLK